MTTRRLWMFGVSVPIPSLRRQSGIGIPHGVPVGIKLLFLPIFCHTKEFVLCIHYHGENYLLY